IDLLLGPLVALGADEVVHQVAALDALGEAVLEALGHPYKLVTGCLGAERLPLRIAHEAVSPVEPAPAPQLKERADSLVRQPAGFRVIRQEDINADVLPVRSG